MTRPGTKPQSPGYEAYALTDTSGPEYSTIGLPYGDKNCWIFLIIQCRAEGSLISIRVAISKLKDCVQGLAINNELHIDTYTK